MNMRELMRIAENAAPVTLYHVTPARNLNAIMRDGITPRIGPRSRKLGEAFPAIYLFPSMVEVEDALSGWLGDQFGEEARLALLAITLPQGTELRNGANYERVVSTTIPPENIRVLTKDALGETDLASLR